MRCVYTVKCLHHLYCSVITCFYRILAMKRYERLHGVVLLIWVKESRTLIALILTCKKLHHGSFNCLD